MTTENEPAPCIEEKTSHRRPAWRMLGLIAFILLITIVPYLIWGPSLELAIEDLLVSDWLASHRAVGGLLVAGLLIADIFLPIPSSFVCTWAGAAWGILWGTLANWLGLNLSAAIGFVSARWALRRLAGEPPSDADIKGGHPGHKRSIAPRVWYLAFCRGLPVLAEGTILFAGARRWPWREIWFPICIANFVLAIGYASLGAVAMENQWLTLAIPLSIALPAIPVSLYLLMRKPN